MYQGGLSGRSAELTTADRSRSESIWVDALETLGRKDNRRPPPGLLPQMLSSCKQNSPHELAQAGVLLGETLQGGGSFIFIFLVPKSSTSPESKSTVGKLWPTGQIQPAFVNKFSLEQ